MRTRKLITKNIGLLAYHLPLSSDPTSVLYGSIQSVQDLDLVREEFSGTRQLAVAEPMTTAHTQQAAAAQMLSGPLRPEYDDRYPCLVIRRNRDRWLHGEITQCVPSMGLGQVFDQIEVDLRTGLFVLRKTDLLVKDQQPLALTRAYERRFAALGPPLAGSCGALRSDRTIWSQLRGDSGPRTISLRVWVAWLSDLRCMPRSNLHWMYPRWS